VSIRSSSKVDRSDAWRRTVPELRPGDELDFRHRRLRATHVMEALARAGGDVERVADVLRRDLSSPYDFLRVAEVYREAGRVEDAIEWAEREIEAFPERGCDEA